MHVLGRRSLLVGAGLMAAFMFAGCGAATDGNTSGVSQDDMAIGNPGSGVTLVEYGSTMCSHCAEFKRSIFERLKENYIDTGRIHFIFREMLTPVDPQRVIPTIALAQYQLARCNNATPEQYFDRLGVLFEQQTTTSQVSSRQGIEAKLVEIAAAAGLSREAVLTCIADPSGAERLNRLSERATRDNVTGTPTFFLNGERLDAQSVMTYEGLSAELDAAITAAALD